MSVSLDFGRVMKWGAVGAAALTLASCVGGCVSDARDDRAIDVAATEVILSKGAGRHTIVTNGVTRVGNVTEGKPVVYRSGTRENPGSPLLLSGKGDVCYIGRFKVVAGDDNMPALKWLGMARRDLTSVVHLNPANAGLHCATGAETGATPAAPTPAPGLR
jgi:hypothetical protein